MKIVEFHHCWCNDCGYTWAARYIEKCPRCGSEDTDGKDDALEEDDGNDDEDFEYIRRRSRTKVKF